MYFSVMPSLENMALTRMAIVLWNKEDIRDSVKNYYCSRLREQSDGWKQIEKGVISKVQNVPVPESLRNNIINFIKPVGLEIKNWIEFHKKMFDSSFISESINILCWTALGTINRKKTAETLIKYEHLTIERSYELACIYCIEEEIRRLWNQIPSNSKITTVESLSSNINECFIEDINQRKLVSLWNYIVSPSDLQKSMDLPDKKLCNEHGFKLAVIDGNQPSTEYFFKKLTVEEKIKVLGISGVYAAHYSDHPFSHKKCFGGVLRFLLSQMNSELRTTVYKMHPAKVLRCFLDWPWQDLCLVMASHVLEFLSERDYNDILNDISEKALEGYKDYHYQILIRDFWRQGSDNQKRYVIGDCSTDSVLNDKCLLLNLLLVNDKESVELILKEATLLEKETIITSMKAKKAFENLILKERWDMIKFFLQECISSREMVIRCRNEFNKKLRIYEFRQPFIPDDIWYHFFKILDSLAQEMKDESKEENPPKKPRL